MLDTIHLPLEIHLVLFGLTGVVVSSQLGDEVSGVLGRIYRQSFRYDEQGASKLGNGKLLSRVL
jgi:hypothetical protein